MYAFRKPFTAGTYQGLSLFGVDYKVSLIILQLIGYALSTVGDFESVEQHNQDMGRDRKRGLKNRHGEWG